MDKSGVSLPHGRMIVEAMPIAYLSFRVQNLTS